MNYWLKQGTRLFTGAVFFTILCMLLLNNFPMSMEGVLKAAGFAAIGALLFWFVGMLIVDIVIKGLVSHIEDDGIELMVEGGLLQRLGEMNKNLVPGGSEMPFTGEVSSTIHVTKEA